MDKQEIKEFMLFLIEEVDMLGEESIYERSADIDKDIKNFSKTIEGYKIKVNSMLE